MKKRLLLADDEEGILALLSATLEGVLFLDILMPKMTGHELCRTLKQDPATATVKVVILTGLSEESEKQKALEVGADEFLTKPFSPMHLLETLERCLNEA